MADGNISLTMTEATKPVPQEEIPNSQRNTKEEDAKIAEINAEGRKIFDDFVDRQRKDKAFAQLDPQSKYEYYMKLFPDFARSMPVILRYITFGMFSEKANFLYLKQCYRLVTKTDEDFCSRQADFVKYLYRCNTKIRGEQLEKIWHDTKKLLMEEMAAMAEERERIKAERLARQDANDEIRREALKAAVVRAISEAKAKLAAERAAEKIAELESKLENTSLETTVAAQPADAENSAEEVD